MSDGILDQVLREDKVCASTPTKGLSSRESSYTQTHVFNTIFCNSAAGKHGQDHQESKLTPRQNTSNDTERLGGKILQTLFFFFYGGKMSVFQKNHAAQLSIRILG
jgi:hypothetical protein